MLLKDDDDARFRKYSLYQRLAMQEDETGPVIPGGCDMARASNDERDLTSIIVGLLLLCYSSFLIYSANFGHYTSEPETAGGHAEGLEPYGKTRRMF